MIDTYNIVVMIFCFFFLLTKDVIIFVFDFLFLIFSIIFIACMYILCLLNYFYLNVYIISRDAPLSFAEFLVFLANIF